MITPSKHVERMQEERVDVSTSGEDVDSHDEDFSLEEDGKYWEYRGEEVRSHIRCHHALGSMCTIQGADVQPLASR